MLLAVGVGAVLVLAGIGAAVYSKLYWNYVFSPAAMDERIADATAVRGYSKLHWVPESKSWYVEPYEGPPTLPRTQDPSYTDEPYYLPRFRVQDHLEGARLLSVRTPPVGDARRDSLIAQVGAAGTSAGFAALLTDFPPMRFPVHVYELSGADGEPTLVVVISGDEVSNDHLPHYELLFDDSADPPRLLSTRHWYFDVAGMEGFEFWAMSMAFGLLLSTLTLPPIIGRLLYRRFSKAGRLARGWCPACMYDLRAEFAAGCPECGWARGGNAAADRDLRRYSLWGRSGTMLTRPPGWRTALIAGGAAVLVWYGMSMPGRVPVAVFWGSVLGVVAGALVLAKLIGVLVRRGRVRVLRCAMLFVLAATLVAAVVVGRTTRWAVLARFSFSRTAMERHATSTVVQQGTPLGGETWVGLYHANQALATTDSANGRIVWVGEAGGSPHMRGFVWYPDGAPAAPQAYTSPIWIEPIGHGWYLWNYDHRDR